MLRPNQPEGAERGMRRVYSATIGLMSESHGIVPHHLRSSANLNFFRENFFREMNNLITTSQIQARDYSKVVTPDSRTTISLGDPRCFVLNWEFSRCSGIALVGVSMICIAMLYLEAILQSIISTIVFVCVRANNRSELLYRSQTTLQHFVL
jgi:hypothetical protein